MWIWADGLLTQGSPKCLVNVHYIFVILIDIASERLVSVVNRAFVADIISEAESRPQIPPKHSLRHKRATNSAMTGLYGPYRCHVLIGSPMTEGAIEANA